MLSRREFGKMAAASMAIGLPLDRITPKIKGVRIGIQSYSLRNMPLDAAIKTMASIGIGECELFSFHVEPPPPFMRPGMPASSFRDPKFREEMKKWQDDLRKWRLEVSPEYYQEVRAKFDAAGVRLHAYNYSFNDGMTDEEMDKGFQAAEALGVDIITASSTLTSAKRLAPIADKYKIRVGMHNHDNTSNPNEFATPESFKTALGYSKRFAVNLDIGHFVAAGYDPVAFIEEHHSLITNLHIKDRKKNHGENTPWGEGDTPIKEVLQLLRHKKYRFPANIEYEYQGKDAPTEVRKCFQYIKDALG